MGLLLRPQSLLTGVNVLATLSLLNFMFISPGILRSQTYSISFLALKPNNRLTYFHKTAYIGDDYPVAMPFPKDMKEMPFVAMTLHETVHYELNMSDPIANREWDSTMLYPRGFGRMHLGPEHRVFNPVFWHELHCLRELQNGLQDRNHPISTPHHVHHCLNYLRQNLLCAADHSLEMGDFMKRDFEIERDAGTKLCRDWERVEALMQRKMLNFFEWMHNN